MIALFVLDSIRCVRDPCVHVRAELIRLDESLRLQVCRRVRRGRVGEIQGPFGQQSCSVSLPPQHMVLLFYDLCQHLEPCVLPLDLLFSIYLICELKPGSDNGLIHS